MNLFLIQFINLLVTVFYIAILARVLLSWFPIGPDSALMPVVRVVFQITEPILGPIRRILPDMGAIDLSPMIAIVVLIIIQRVIPMLL
jgi:YggT family protein